MAWEDAWDNSSLSMIYKVGNFAKAVFLILLGLPLFGIAHRLYLAYREQIPDEVYKKEFADWKEKDKGMYPQRFLECLIAAKIKPADCPYKMIFTARWLAGNNPNVGLFEDLDGLFSHQKPVINALQSGETLLIYFPEGRSALADMIHRQNDSLTRKREKEMRNREVSNPISSGLGDPYSLRIKESLIAHAVDLKEDRLHVLWLDHEPLNGHDPFSKRFLEVVTAKRI